MSGDRLAELLDHRAIVEVTVRYCWALDERRFADLDGIFAPDGTADYGGGRGLLTGPAAIGAFCERILVAYERTQHSVTNHEISISGDGATCRCYFRAQHVRQVVGGDENLIIAGTYGDDLRRAGDRWLIARRTLRVSWRQGPSPAAGPGRPGL